jgi:hypothetical protein
MSTPGNEPLWAAGKLTALRTGQRLVTEVPASQPGRPAFVDITPSLPPPGPAEGVPSRMIP